MYNLYMVKDGMSKRNFYRAVHLNVLEGKILNISFFLYYLYANKIRKLAIYTYIYIYIYDERERERGRRERDEE